MPRNLANCLKGEHEWYSDVCMFTSAQKCRHCDTYQNQSEAAALAEERQRWLAVRPIYKIDPDVAYDIIRQFYPWHAAARN